MFATPNIFWTSAAYRNRPQPSADGDWASNTGTGVAVDSGDLANQIGLNTINSNGSADAVDVNAICGTNLWFLHQIGMLPAQACIK